MVFAQEGIEEQIFQNNSIFPVQENLKIPSTEYNDGELQVTSDITAYVNATTGVTTITDTVKTKNLTEDKKISFNSVKAILNEGFESENISN